ncbi:hypothetical protein LZ30DRAFT_323637 [Colletotrichum cereale]|nr:hypothetical protein LZ30DRAFT_323637 [Colletotrichum cereale]
MGVTHNILSTCTHRAEVSCPIFVLCLTSLHTSTPTIPHVIHTNPCVPSRPPSPTIHTCSGRNPQHMAACGCTMNSPFTHTCRHPSFALPPFCKPTLAVTLVPMPSPNDTWMPC